MDNAETLAATEIAWLRGGNWGAVMAGLAMLHTRGVLAPGAGRIRRTGSLPQDAEPLERALYAALYGSIGPRELAGQKRVQRALRDVRRSLVERGLVRATSRRVLMPVLLVVLPPVLLAKLVALRAVGVTEGLVAVVVLVGIAVWLRPRRTVAGTRALAAGRVRYGDLVERSQLEPVEVGLAVALFGTPAILALMPRFAWGAGLLDGGRSSNHFDSRLDSSPWGANTDSFWN
ncbi:TIGR04222 domain-containing protein [Micromonospora rhizosphaerae]|uniref:TIGR04222 domain-containing protein n=1 Tax=Micromonospora rhizosphaerae TaxID=568872 RepID=A0A1C6R8W3_9ACTN|nr:TIGR04222 domain-containing membrane protein [Micromonospora rhizosphaerae]SCL13523.1 TIGR04222 domain-containing protein [Micromonospora rhizosphaerae]